MDVSDLFAVRHSTRHKRIHAHTTDPAKDRH